MLVINATFNGWQGASGAPIWRVSRLSNSADYSTGRVMDSISHMLSSTVLVLRNGETTEQPSNVLVPGDIVSIRLGNKLAADVRFLDASSDFKLDKSILTGESEPVSCGSKATADTTFMESSAIGLQGSLCVSGSATGVVVLTGDK